jgi:hypothetical protein
VFTARYALSPYIKQTRFVFKGLNVEHSSLQRSVLQQLRCASCYVRDNDTRV